MSKFVQRAINQLLETRSVRADAWCRIRQKRYQVKATDDTVGQSVAETGTTCAMVGTPFSGGPLMRNVMAKQARQKLRRKPRPSPASQ